MRKPDDIRTCVVKRAGDPFGLALPSQTNPKMHQVSTRPTGLARRSTRQFSCAHRPDGPRVFARQLDSFRFVADHEAFALT
jgi:hypothetical protein